ncbi:hypothetical protein AGABI1DRAFT_115615 [Agaricus bisporus var. burnettii JB137-S8]|uniref:FAD-binding PCMH-type domain-containing protein n=1 Tax=Agaricus bisporus var. burnettii (strain JB137-S8 / ATCC MYA-4627 / FGSC 10392) TaxID=597362 RepID=K5X1F1_AGABU|nr:uncharacterized protein AGABI1DRAFT_115615 [Agaricus bisporus var. burnettii JB137-S8]EKM76727.1 hypothetical protein AGABI1DRAFT_115615 [Agaricus bisporus var. burnettii JB137-S8]
MAFYSANQNIPSIVLPSIPEYRDITRNKGAISEEHAKEIRALLSSDDQLLLPAPGAVVVPSTAEEIASTVSFARNHNILLTFKNGGNSFAGYCLNLGGIVIDLCRFKKIHIDDKANVVTIQAGCIWSEVYNTLSKQDPSYIVVGGRCPNVGVSGYTLGGGFSPFTRSHGLGIDNVIEMTVVTPAGQILTLNDKVTDAHQRDLYWALRGGGGGNFGFLVEFKTQLHRLSDANAKVACGPLSWDLSDKDARGRFEAAMDVFNTREWPKELTIDAIWRYKGDQLLGEMTTIFDGNLKKCMEVLDPLLKFQPTNAIAEMQWHEWLVAEQGFDSLSPVYHHHTSFIFGQGAITPTVTKAITSLMEESHELLGRKGKSHFLWDMAGYKSTTVAPDATPYYWREGIYIIAFKLQWEDPAMKASVLAFTEKIKNTLQPHALEHRAAYLNYIDPTVDDWAYAYYGKNYARLQEIKQHWDPTNFFHFPQSITPAIPEQSSDAREPHVARSLLTTGRNTASIDIASNTSSHAAEAQGVDEGRLPLTALEATAAMWDQFLLLNPIMLWGMEEFDAEKFLTVIGGERMQAD